MKRNNMILPVAIIAILLFSSALILSGWSPMTSMGNSQTGGMMGGMTGHNNTIKLINSTAPLSPLNIPPILKSDSVKGSDVYYSLTVQKGSTSFKKDKATQTLGYNGSLLGPTIVVQKGQNVHIKATNTLSNPTTLHWHGLEIPSDVDRGPNSPIESGKTANISFTVNQQAATLWYHPHAMGMTAEQVYNGLAGFLLVQDENSSKLALPKTYGRDDIPVVVQDRSFDKNNQFSYKSVYNPDGVTGDTLLVNGTINPYIHVKDGLIRLRLLNGSNSRSYDMKLSDDSSFHQIASDGGFLAAPVKLNQVVLSPGERAEIVLDMSKYKRGDTVKLMDGKIVILTMKMTAGNLKSVPLPSELNSIESVSAPSAIDKSITLLGMNNMVNINGKQFDMGRIDFTATQNKPETWEIYNAPDMMGGMLHSFHIHGVQFRILSRNGKTPPANEQGWKDTVALNAGDSVILEVNFPYAGVFMYHCHNLEHEDNGMMGQIKVKPQS